MNRRILKKRCKHGMRQLIKHANFKTDEFGACERGETIAVRCARWPRHQVERYRFIRGDEGRVSLLRNTPQHWSCCVGEWDTQLPSEMWPDQKLWIKGMGADREREELEKQWDKEARLWDAEVEAERKAAEVKHG